MNNAVLEVAGLRIGGGSVGGMHTCIDLPAWKLCVDLGACSEEAIQRKTVLFTHAHIDHMGAVAWHCSMRELRGMPPPTYVVPSANEEAFEGLFEAWRKLDRSDMPHRTVALAPGDEHVVRNDLVARPFRSPHRVLTQGYALWSHKRQLRAEFRGLPEANIRRLRVDEGVDVSEVLEVPEFAFCGDTTIEVVEREEVVRQARVLVLECTFLDERVSVESAREKGHVHLDEIIERAELFQNEAIVLSHFSARYRARDVRRILAERLPAGLIERVVPLLIGFPS